MGHRTSTFDLKTPADLREKLRRDLARLKSSPLDSDAAFNFFVTAEHMVDWVYPGRANAEKRKRARKSSALLRVCSHLANGAKHLELDDGRHDSVSSTIVLGGFGVGGYGEGGYGSAALWVRLQGDAAKELGTAADAVDLAGRVMEFWDSHPLA